MNLTIVEVDDVPSDAYLSVRVGESKKLRPFRTGESFSFVRGGGGDASGGWVQFDAFEKLGTLITNNVPEPAVVDEQSGARETTWDVRIPAQGSRSGEASSFRARLRLQASEGLPGAERRERAHTRHKLALDAKNYLDCNDVWGAIQGMLHSILKHQPQDPVGFMVNYLSDLQGCRCRAKVGVSPETTGELTAPDPSTRDLGLPESVIAEVSPQEQAGAPSMEQTIDRQGTDAEEDVPHVPPEIAACTSLAASLLLRTPSVYHTLKERHTDLGTSFAQCLQPSFARLAGPAGVTEGCELVSTASAPIGAAAGDEEAYEVFRDFFDPLIDELHGESASLRVAGTPQPLTDLSDVSSRPLDPTGRYAICARLVAGRNIRGIRMPPACDHHERKEVERAISAAVLSLDDADLTGEYFPLAGSESFPSKPGGMTHSDAVELTSRGLLFARPPGPSEPGAAARFNFGLRWPEARGVFLSRSREFAAWCNEQEHLRLLALEPAAVVPSSASGGPRLDLRAALGRLARAAGHVEASLQKEGYEFASCERLGFLTASPGDLGAGLRASVVLRLPLLSRHLGLEQVCANLGLRAQGGARAAALAKASVATASASSGDYRGGDEDHDFLEVMNRNTLGLSEVDVVKIVIDGSWRLVRLEQRLEQDAAVSVDDLVAAATDEEDLEAGLCEADATQAQALATTTSLQGGAQSQALTTTSLHGEALASELPLGTLSKERPSTPTPGACPSPTTATPPLALTAEINGVLVDADAHQEAVREAGSKKAACDDAQRAFLPPLPGMHGPVSVPVSFSLSVSGAEDGADAGACVKKEGLEARPYPGANAIPDLTWEPDEESSIEDCALANSRSLRDDGAGDWCPGSFPRERCPKEMPDLSAHHSIMADVLRRDSAVYEHLRLRRTSLGTTLATCVKSGMDNPGHALVKTLGAVAGDEECYDVFRELFDPILMELRNGYAPGTAHCFDLAPEKVSDTPIDPSGCYALSVRIRCSRSLRGLRLPPACDRAERCEVERALTGAFFALQDEDLRGDYFPLSESTSYRPKPRGMSQKEEQELLESSFLFQEPDSSALLCSGVGRHWPEARGVFAAASRKMAAWLNEEEHLRLVSLQIGGSLKEVFERLSRALAGLEKSLAKEGYAFARSDRLGYIASCPSNLGTSLRANVLLRIPLLSRHSRFFPVCRSHGLLARTGVAMDASGNQVGVCDVSIAERWGASEVQQASALIEGCAKLVLMEQALEQGQDLPAVA